MTWTYDPETGYSTNELGEVRAGDMRIAATAPVIPPTVQTLTIELGAGLAPIRVKVGATPAQRWAAVKPYLIPDAWGFGGTGAMLPGFPINAAIPRLPGHRTVWLGGASTGIDNKDAIIAALNKAGALYDPALSAYDRAWYVAEAKAGSIPTPTNKDNKSDKVFEGVVLGTIGAIAAAGVVSAINTAAGSAAGSTTAATTTAPGTLQTAAGGSLAPAAAAESAADLIAAATQTAGAEWLQIGNYELAIQTAQAAGASLAESAGASLLDIATHIPTPPTGAATSGATAVDESLADIMTSTGNTPAYEWMETYEQTIAEGLEAGRNLASGVAGGSASAGAGSLSDIFSGIGSAIRNAAGAVAAIGSASAALTGRGNGTVANKPPNTAGALGGLNLGVIALAGLAFFALKG